MKTWKKLALVAGAAGALFATGAWAFGRMGGGMRMMKHMIAAHVEEAEARIGATPDQRKVIDGAKDAIVASLESRIAGHQAQRQRWMALLTADQLDTAAIYAEVDKRTAEIQAAAHEIVPQLAKIHDVLTPAQRQQLADHLKAMRRHRMGMHPGGPHAPGGFGGPEDDE